MNKSKGFFCKAESFSCEVFNGDEIHFNSSCNLENFGVFHDILNQPFAYALYQRKNLSLHASAIEINNDGYLFIGLSGGGKSYILSQLLDYGKCISEDIVRITFHDGIPYIHPSHGLTKLNSLKHTKNDYFKFNSKLLFDTRNRSSFLIKNKYLSSKPVKLKACFLLNFSNTFLINELNERQSFAALMQSSFKSNPLFSSKENDVVIDNLISDVINKTKFYILNRMKGDNISIELIKFIKNNLK